MKCDKLLPIHVPAEMCGERTLAEAFDYYDREPVDEAIDELKEKLRLAEIEELKAKRALWLARAGEASKEVNYWTCQDESSYAIVDFNVRHETIVSYKAPHHRPYKWILIWEEVERRCRAKAEEYK